MTSRPRVVSLAILAALAGCGQPPGQERAASAPAQAAALSVPQIWDRREIDPVAQWQSVDPAVASDGSRFLAVYREWRDAYAPDLYAVVLTAETGSAPWITPSAPQLLAHGTPVTEADVAWDGTNYVVVYTTWDASSKEQRSWAVRVSPEGARVDPTPLPLPIGGRIACAAGTCFLASVGDGVRVARLDPGGWTADAPVSLASGADAAEVALATDGASFAAAWIEGSRVKLARFAPSGQPLDAAPLVVAAEVASAVDVDGAPDGYLVAWTTPHLSARRVGPDGAFLDASPLRAGWWWTDGEVAATHDATGWSVLCPYYSQESIYTTRIRFDGSLENPSSLWPVGYSGAGWQIQPAAAWNGSTVLALWAGDPQEDASQVFANMLDGPAPRLGEGVVVSDRPRPLPPAQHDPAAACSTGVPWFAWEEERSAESWFVRGPGLPADGGGADQLGPRVAELPRTAGRPDGVRLIAYQELVPGDPFPISSVRVDVADDASRRSATLARDAYHVSAAPLGADGFLVAWTAASPQPSSIAFTRVPADLASPVPPATSLATGAFQDMPAVAWNGAEALIVWRESTSSRTLRGARLAENGTVQGQVELPIEAPPHGDSPLAVAGSARTWLVAWIEGSHDAGRIRARLLAPDGAPASDPFTLAEGLRGAQGLTALWDGAAFTLAWKDLGTGSIHAAVLDERGVERAERVALRSVAPASAETFGLCSPTPGFLVFAYTDRLSLPAPGTFRVFERDVQAFALSSLAVMAAGPGTVRSEPAGIDCGRTTTDCWVELPPWSQVRLTPQPAAGFEFRGWSGACSGTGECTPDLSAGRLQVSAEFGPPRIPVTVRTTGTGTGNVYSYPDGVRCGEVGGPCTASFDQGVGVELEAYANPGSVFVAWTGPCRNLPRAGDPRCQVDVAAAAEVEARFDTGALVAVERTGSGEGVVRSEPAGIDCGDTCAAGFPQGPVALVPTAAPGSYFAGWEAGPLHCDPYGACETTFDVWGDTRLVARFETGWALTVEKVGTGSGRITSDLRGIDCGERCTAVFPPGLWVNLTVTPEPGTFLTGFSDNCLQTGPDTCQVTLQEVNTVQVHLARAATLTVEKSGGGAGRVTSDLPGIDCGERCVATYLPGTSVTLTVVPEPGTFLLGFEGCLQADATRCRVAPQEAATVRVLLAPAVPLQVVTAGSGAGRVWDDDGLIDCGDTCLAAYRPGSWIVLHASFEGSVFAGWTGCDYADWDTCGVRLDHAREVRAQFEAAPPPLEVTIAGLGGKVTTSPGGLTCASGATPCTWLFDLGVQVTLTASATSSNVAFVGWSGACAGTQPVCVVSMAAAARVKATFAPMVAPLPLEVAVAGLGGKVTTSPGGLACTSGTMPCTWAFAPGTQVTLTASATSSNVAFVGWSGACAGTQPVCVVSMLGARTVEAVFAPGVLVSVTISGPGFVTSTPAGISSSARSAYFPYGASVTLTATPKAPARFASWSGSCSGTSPSCTISATQARSVTARFLQ